MSRSSASLVWRDPYTADMGNARVPPAWSTCPHVSTVRRTGRPSFATAAANGSHWEGTISVSTTVSPSSSTITPALATPARPSGATHANTPGASSSRVGPAIARGYARTRSGAAGHGFRSSAPLGYPPVHVRTQSQPPAPHLPRRARLEREDARQGSGPRRRHGVPRPRGLRRAAREGRRPRQRGARHQRARLGRHRPLRARQRVGHEVDLPRRDHTSWRARASGSTRSCCRRCSAASDVVALDLLLTQIEQVDGPSGPGRHRGADRDRAGPHQRGGDLRGLRPHGDDRVRPRRLRGVDRDAGAHRRCADPGVPRRPLPLRVRQDPHGRACQRACR